MDLSQSNEIYYFESKPYTGETRDYYPPHYDTITVEYFASRGWVELTPPPELQLVGNYVDGKKTGTWTSYFENGRVSSLVEYQENELHGNYIMFHTYGDTSLAGQYEMGVPYGVFRAYHIGGFNERRHYKDGKLNGPITYHGTAGRLVKERMMKDGRGNGPFKVYFPNGSLKSVVNEVEGKFDGERKMYHLSGEIAQIDTFVDGHLEGVQTTFFRSGQKHFERPYSKGVLDGIVIEHDQRGKMVSAGEFRKGKYIRRRTKAVRSLKELD